MVTMRQNLGLATKKLMKSTQGSKNLCDDKIKKTMKKIKLQKSKLELHLQEVRSLVKELMHTGNDNNILIYNETDLGKNMRSWIV